MYLESYQLLSNENVAGPKYKYFTKDERTGYSELLKWATRQNTVDQCGSTSRHNGWNPAVFRECLVGKTQAVVVVVWPARCDWCLRPTVTVNTLC